MAIKRLGGGMALLEKAGENYLALETGFKRRALIGHDLTALRTVPGKLLHCDGTLDEWTCDGVFESDGYIFFFGAWLPGKPLSEIRSLDSKALSLFIELLENLCAMKNYHYPFHANGFYLTERGEWLFLPPLLMQFIADRNDQKQNMKNREPYNHPALSPAENVSFALGTLVYKLRTGEFPYNGNSPEDIHEMILYGKSVDACFLVPDIPSSLSEILQRALSPNRLKTLPSLKEWKDNDIFAQENLSSQERERLLRQGEAAKTKIAREMSRRRFWRKRRFPIIVSAMAFIIVAYFVSVPIRQKMAPPATDGFSIEEVVEAYYTMGLNGLDSQLIDKLLIGRSEAGKFDIRLVTNYFVQSRVRLGYEGKTGLITPKEWLEEERTLEVGEAVYGIDDLFVMETAPQTFVVDYKIWLPGEASDDASAEKSVKPRIFRRKDYIHLTWKRNNWYIDSLERRQWEESK